MSFGELDGVPYMAIGNGEPCPWCKKPWDESHIQTCLLKEEQP